MSKGKQAVKAVPITIDYPAFQNLLNTGAATLSKMTGRDSSNPGRAQWQRELVLNGKIIPAGHYKKGDAGARLYESNPDAVARALLGEGRLADQAVTSMGFAQLVAVYLGAEASMPREHAFAASVLEAYAKYNEVASVSEMLVEPTAKARTASGVDQAEIDAIWS